MFIYEQYISIILIEVGARRREDGMKSKKLIVYEILKQRIVNHDIKPGEPINDGTIDFFPAEGNQATKSGAQILKGSYKIPAEFGLLPGKYRVSITAGDGRTRPDAPADQPPGPTGANIVSKDRVPKEYNLESKVEVDVTEKGPNVFDYDIP